MSHVSPGSRVVSGGTTSRGFRQNHAVSGLGRFGNNGGGGFGGGGFLSGLGGFGPFGGLGNYYPGAVFGYDLAYLRSRAISAVGGFGTASTGTPQDATTDASGGSTAPASTSATGNSVDNIANGEAAFRAGDYRLAIDEWGKALAGGPQDPLLQMMLGQAYFAAGSYRDAAVATQAAMHALRSDDWGVVVSHRDELYGVPQKYNLQLQKLDIEAKEKPEDPALQFLLGFHYAYLDYPQPAVTQLDKAVKLEPRDEMAAQLRALLAARLPDAAAPVITPGAVTPAIYR